MQSTQNQCLIREIRQPTSAENLVGRSPVKEGKNLPASIEEDVGSFSLCPSYSRIQLRRIHRLKMKKSCNEMGRKSLKDIPEEDMRI